MKRTILALTFFLVQLQAQTLTNPDFLSGIMGITQDTSSTTTGGSEPPVGDYGPNLVDNAGFEDGELGYWWVNNYGNTGAVVEVLNVEDGAIDGNWSMQFYQFGTNGDITDRPLLEFEFIEAVEASTTYKVEFDYSVTSGTARLVYIHLGTLRTQNISLSGSGHFSADILSGTSGSQYLWTYWNGSAYDWNIIIDNVQVRKIL